MKNNKILISTLLILFWTISCDKSSDSKKSVEKPNNITNKDSLLTASHPLSKDTLASKPNDKIFSELKNKVIAYENSDIKLNPVDSNSNIGNAFVVFNTDRTRAELFLPNATSGLILDKRGKEGDEMWTDGHYELFEWKGYVLRYKNGPNIFTGDTK